MLLELSTWQEVERYLARSTGIIIPIGSMEQHGPNGVIATDSICAEVIARRAGAAGDILVGPTVNLGVAQFNLGFAGTVSLRAHTLMAVITDYVQSLARHGFERCFFLNGHGANIAPANAAFQDIYAEQSLGLGPAHRARVRCRIRSWWEYDGPNRLREQLYGEWEGLHATPSEVAMAQYALREAIKQADMDQPVALTKDFYRNFGGDRHFDAEHHRSRFPDGRVGSDPSLANPADGKRLIDAAVPEVVADFHAFLAED